MSDTRLPVPQEGGSYIREKDGTLRRTAFTRQPGDPGSGSGAGPEPPAAEPKAAAKAATAEPLAKKGK